MTTLVLVMLVFCAIIAAVALGVRRLCASLVKLGVIVREAQRPPLPGRLHPLSDRIRLARYDPEEERV